MLCTATFDVDKDLLATSELRERNGNSDVDNASRDCFWGRVFCLRPLKQSHDALSTSLLPGLLRNSEMANICNAKTTTSLIRFRMPPFLIQRKRIQISASTLAFSNRFRPSTLAVRKRYVFVLRGRLQVHDVSVFEYLRPSTPIRKASVFESLHLGRRFRKPPFSAWVKVSVFHRISVDDRRKRILKSMRFQTKTD